MNKVPHEKLSSIFALPLERLSGSQEGCAYSTLKVNGRGLKDTWEWVI